MYLKTKHEHEHEQSKQSTVKTRTVSNPFTAGDRLTMASRPTCLNEKTMNTAQFLCVIVMESLSVTSRYHGAKKVSSKQTPKLLPRGSRCLCSKGQNLSIIA